MKEENLLLLTGSSAKFGTGSATAREGKIEEEEEEDREIWKHETLAPKGGRHRVCYFSLVGPH